MSAPKKAVLAYSGGLDTSAIIPWLKHQGYDVHAVLVDVGQDEDFSTLVRCAIKLGAETAVIRDARPEILREIAPYVLGLGATFEEQYRLGTAIARPFIALEQVRRAQELGCTTLVHGATGKGNDQIRFEYAYRTLAPQCEVIAPWKSWDLTGRQELADYVTQFLTDAEFEIVKTYSLDENLWHLSVEGGALEQPTEQLDISSILAAVQERFYGASAPQQASTDARTITFKDGVPIKLDGRAIGLAEILRILNFDYRHCSWAWDLVLENRQTGIKSRGLYINPAAKLLQLASDGLARAVFNRPTYELRAQLGRSYADVLYKGSYFSSQRQVVESGAAALLGRLNGEVTVVPDTQPYVAQINATGSLFTQQDATFETSDFDHRDAQGFIELSYRSEIGHAVQGENHEDDSSAVEAGVPTRSGLSEVSPLSA